MSKENMDELRRQAEERLVRQEHQIKSLERVDLATLAQELAVHQVELEIQNEELRQSRALAEEARDRYFDLYDFAPVGYFTLDEHNRVVEANLTGCRLLQLDRHKLLNTQFTKFITDDEADSYYLYHKKALESENRQTLELKMRKSDGTYFYAQLDSIKVGEERLSVAVSDITERKKAEEVLAKLRDEVEIRVKERTIELAKANIALGLEMEERKRTEESLRESERKYRTLVENVPQAIFLKDTNSVYISCNDNYARDFKIGPKEIVGKTDYEFRPRKLAEKDRADDRRIIETGETNTFEEKYVQDGQERIVRTDKTPVRDEKGNVVGVLGISQDITERKRMEEELQKIDKLESVGTLAGGIAHDFNNLLTGILGNISLAKRYVEEKGKAFDRLVEAEKASLRARDLTQQLLTFAKGGAPIKKLVSIGGVVKESATLALTGSNVRSDFNLPDDLWTVEIDEGQMSQVINNIVINAVQAMPQGGLVKISAKNLIINKKGSLPLPKGNYIEVTIEDHGIGMPKDYLDRMFEPYFTTKQKGSGLGLAMAYSIIKNHEGHIAIESTPTVGTTVSIYLPAEKRRIYRQRGEEAIQPSLVSQGKVLVMDDEEVIRLLINELLTSTGYEVELSKDGVEAVELYRKARESGQPFDAVILDLTVPGGMGGKETMKKLLEMDSEAKVIVSSGYSTAPIMSEYKKYGFRAVVTKPYTVSNMEKTLHDVLVNK